MHSYEHKKIKDALAHYDACEKAIEVLHAKREQLEQLRKTRRELALVAVPQFRFKAIKSSGLVRVQSRNFQERLLRFLIDELSREISEIYKFQQGLECPAGTDVTPEPEGKKK